MEINPDGEAIVISVEPFEVGILRDLANQLLDITAPDSEVVNNEDPLAALIGIDVLAQKTIGPDCIPAFP